MGADPAQVIGENIPNEFAYLEKYGTRRIYNIPTCYDKLKLMPCQMFRARITHVYDPSKFWMVIKTQELDVFNKYLFRFYYPQNNKYRIPEDKLTVDMYCVVFMDGAYYRGVIVGAPAFHLVEPTAQVYFIDYATSHLVSVKNIFYMSENCCKVPQFAMRATLASVCPKGGQLWSVQSLDEFHSLVDKKDLVGAVVHVDSTTQVLHVQISEVGKPEAYIHKTLIDKRYAQYTECAQEKPDILKDVDNVNITPKVKYPFLFPTHQAIESGKIPITLYDLEYQMTCCGNALSGATFRYYKSKES